MVVNMAANGHGEYVDVMMKMVMVVVIGGEYGKDDDKCGE